jgi:hypothetical protein
MLSSYFFFGRGGGRGAPRAARRARTAADCRADLVSLALVARLLTPISTLPSILAAFCSCPVVWNHNPASPALIALETLVPSGAVPCA